MPTTAEKDNLSNQLEAIVDSFKAQLKPIPDPQRFNHCIDITSKWQKNYFYIKQKFKAADEGRERYFEIGIARLKYNGPDSFDLAYFRHTGKWFPLWTHEGISLEEATKAILNYHVFQVM